MNDVALFPSIEVEHVEGALQGWADRLNAVPITARQVQEGYDVYLTARVPRAREWSAADRSAAASALAAYAADQGLVPPDVAAASILLRSRRLNAATHAFAGDIDGAYLDRLALEPITLQDFGVIDPFDDRQLDLDLFEPEQREASAAIPPECARRSG